MHTTPRQATALWRYLSMLCQAGSQSLHSKYFETSHYRARRASLSALLVSLLSALHLYYHILFVHEDKPLLVSRFGSFLLLLGG